MKCQRILCTTAASSTCWSSHSKNCMEGEEEEEEEEEEDSYIHVGTDEHFAVAYEVLCLSYALSYKLQTYIH